MVFALSGKKTLLVGADLRRPKIFTDFELSNDHGISSYLTNLSDVDNILQTTNIENLDLLGSGPVPPNPSELLMNPKMDDLMTQLKKRYEYIILDTPPIGLVTDAFILMKHANLSIYLIRQNITPKGTIKNAQEMYENGQLNNVCLLFNDVKVQKYGYGYGYGYNYGYNNGYYSESAHKRSKHKV